MRDLTKAQLTIGFLAYFATIWEFVYLRQFPNILTAASLVVLHLLLLLVLSYVLLAILEWVNIFDLRTNAVLTLLVLVTVRVLTSV
ncbi:MAG: hypothetical protein KKC68_01795 [Candidatus Thermoplasmatota archaeon]|nr:hypothetical protein [Candidatus Thermoplasmatota archaeon]MBU1940481.1 hypothetical protein [Candidatus Thermoplasmatota archaeon]